MATAPPTYLLFDDRYARPAAAKGTILQRKYEKKFDMGMAVCAAVGRDGMRALVNDDNAWAWLSMYFHETTLPKKSDGWFVGDSSRHLVERIRGRSQDQSHRHLVKGATTNCFRFGTYARVLMDRADGQSKIE